MAEVSEDAKKAAEKGRLVWRIEDAIKDAMMAEGRISSCEPGTPERIQAENEARRAYDYAIGLVHELAWPVKRSPMNALVEGGRVGG